MTPPRRRSLPPFLRFLLGHCLVGAGLGMAAALGIVWLDVGGIGTMVAGGARQGWIAVALLCFGFVVTFGSLAMGSAIFMLGLPERERDDDGTAPQPDHRLAAIRIGARRGRHRR